MNTYAEHDRVDVLLFDRTVKTLINETEYNQVIACIEAFLQKATVSGGFGSLAVEGADLARLSETAEA